MSDEVSNEANATGSLAEQLKEAQLATKREQNRKLKRENDIAEGLLVSADEVQHRVATAANEFRAGTEFRKAAEAVRRDVLANCPAEARDAVMGALDAGLERLRERVSRALEG